MTPIGTETAERAIHCARAAEGRPRRAGRAALGPSHQAFSWGRTSIIGLALAAALRAGSAAAETTLTLTEVFASIDHYNPRLEAARAAEREAEGHYLNARGAFDPNLLGGATWQGGTYPSRQVDIGVYQPTPFWGLDLHAGYRISDGDFPVYKGKNFTGSLGELSAAASIPIYRGGPIDRARADRMQTEIGVVAARARLRAERLALRAAAASAYAEWVRLSWNLAIDAKLLQLAEERQEWIEAKAEMGALAPIVAVDNRSLLVLRQLRLVEATRQRDQAAVRLALYLRAEDGVMSPPAQQRVPESLKLPPEEVPEARDDRDAPARPEVDVLGAQADIASTELRLRQNHVAPDARLHGFVARDFGETKDGLDERDIGLGVTLRWPVPLRRERGARDAAEGRKAAIDAELQWTTDQISTEVEGADISVAAARQAIALADEQRVLAERLAAAERETFEEGFSTLVIVNLRELTAAEAAKSARNAEVAVFLAALEARRARGTL